MTPTKPPEPAPDCPSTRRHGTAVAYNHDRCRCPTAKRADKRDRARRANRRVAQAAGRVSTGRPRIPGPDLTDGTGTRRRLEALMTLGWPQPKLAAELGGAWPKVCHARGTYTHVWASTAVQVRDLYERLWNVPGPSKRAAAHARRLGYLPPMAWDEDTIDDPNAQPYREMDDKGRVYSKWRPCRRRGCVQFVTAWNYYCGGCRPKVEAERAERDRQRTRANRGHAGEQLRVCGLESCNAEFSTVDRRHTYCSPGCAATARRAYWRRCQVQKKARRAGGLAVAS